MSLTSAPVSANELEESVMKLFDEWLRLWFNGASHTLGGEGSILFPAATVRCQQSSLTQPLSGAGITAVWVAATNVRTMKEAGHDVAWDHATWFFMVRHATDENACRRASDRLFGLLRNSAGTKPLSEKGIHKVRPGAPQLISDGKGSASPDPNYVIRLVTCSAMLRYPIYPYAPEAVAPPPYVLGTGGELPMGTGGEYILG